MSDERNNGDPSLSTPEPMSEPPPTQSDPPPSGPNEPTEGGGDFDEVDVRDLLRSALAPPKGSVAPSLLPGVQKRLRVRSRGKFYGDGWSTAEAPRSTYLITSLVMLALLALAFLVLMPWGGGVLP